MKKALLLTFFMFSVSLYAQQEQPPLYLEYDASGNQILSDLVCVNCPGAEGKHSLDNVTYYPNPVAEQLNLTWENTGQSRVTAVKVYGLGGKLVTSNTILSLETELSLNFSDKTAGIYIVELLSSDGDKKSFKIIKK
ncbi:MAG: T9SS type A sorting domain-containing protein [Sinomicrobium sp.]|nr:T9SS type A sorting domain-containing protein [Sinomicrobium sp.]